MRVTFKISRTLPPWQQFVTSFHSVVILGEERRKLAPSVLASAGLSLKGNIWLAGNVGLQLLVRMPRLTRSPSLLHLRLKLATRRHARRYRVLCSLSSRSSRATISHRARAESTENARGNKRNSKMQSMHHKVWH